MKIDFNEQKITGITQSDLDGWRDRYPAVNLELALQKALDWVLRNGVQLRNADLFLERWLFRSQYGFEEA
ncbi:MAG TPA: hypothetical protein VEJ63_03940, partial [Planctomycetota bacterium]|nr:hypothetical protein [Planctomycetota bacterium]